MTTFLTILVTVTGRLFVRCYKKVVHWPLLLHLLQQEYEITISWALHQDASTLYQMHRTFIHQWQFYETLQCLIMALCCSFRGLKAKLVCHDVILFDIICDITLYLISRSYLLFMLVKLLSLLSDVVWWIKHYQCPSAGRVLRKVCRMYFVSSCSAAFTVA